MGDGTLSTATLPKLVVKDLDKTYTVDEGGGKLSHVHALKGINLEVQEGEFVSIIGPSGCGKSTLLMILAGLYPKTSGQILIGDKRIEGPGMDRGVVFQEFALFPWLTVEGNIRFALSQKGIPQGKQKGIVDKYIELVGLRGFGKVYPFRLSGGMKQRVAVARALAYEPEVLLMDEPFGQLDAPTRGSLQKMLNEIWERTNATILFVTHSIKEALYLSDRVVVLSCRPGTIVEDLRLDLPRPRDPWDQKFIDYQHRLAVLLGGEEAGFF
ncbi:hypothetical protein SY88_12455 [Clostridiales bacterium PH28_bin88]|nr:hypothetical protein SY88_12455 [Clostridiales bacterium PH28_bin88]